MAYVFRLPADVTALVDELEGSLCQTLAARGGTPCARAVKAGLAFLPPSLVEYAAEVASDRGSPAWVPCVHCSGAPWSPGLVKWVLNDWLVLNSGPYDWLRTAGYLPPRIWEGLLDCMWSGEAGCRARQGASIEVLERGRDARLRDMWFQRLACEAGSAYVRRVNGSA